MENFLTLTGTVSGSDVVLSWTLPVAGATAVQVQRTPYGSNAWANIGASLATTTLTYTDSAPETGQYAYRLAVTTTLGGVDNAGTLVYSNVFLASNTAATGAITLTGSVASNVADPVGPANYSRVALSWTIDDGGANDDALKVEIQRSLNSGTTWRHAGNQNTFGATSFSEMLPTGIGSVQYRVVASLPQEADQLNTPKTSTSNVVTLTV